ncbi:hypothetical protein EK21DRAFT_73222 [Setomelanomma holmii]|uniref:Uncharacterized protein n=1 Tax=Setomelanomma holmii TaxID=210430 RepID=A0A9P4H202_9PLEO|nr:hypothetical protein EK21DRAFT_73222 [Setomelanomma holmii]
MSGSVIARQNNDTSYVDAISDYVDSMYDNLRNISQNIHENPELGFKEIKAHDLLTSSMEAQDGWNVTRSLYNINTSFSAIFKGAGDGPIVSFISEYGIHNLIATVGLTGALAAAKIMKEQGLPGKVVLFGTPAKESLAGKVDMLEAGVFDDYNINISQITHPSNGADTPYMRKFSKSRLDLEYYGKTAHASAALYQSARSFHGSNRNSRYTTRMEVCRLAGHIRWLLSSRRRVSCVSKRH